MAHMLTALVFALALALPTSDFDGTDDTVAAGENLNIVYSGPDGTITITDGSEGGPWEVQIVNGHGTWEVPLEAEDYLFLQDSHDEEWVTLIIES